MEVKILKSGLFALDVRTIKYLNAGEVLDLSDEQAKLVVDSQWGSVKENMDYHGKKDDPKKEIFDSAVLAEMVKKGDFNGVMEYGKSLGVPMKNTSNTLKLAKQIEEAFEGVRPSNAL